MNSEPFPLARFLRRSAAFLLIQLVIVASVVSLGSPGNSNHYLGAIQDKIQRLETSTGPRMVILGGSNVAFGIQSPMIQRSIHMETVNLGLHASLGLPFQIECYLQHARSGDIVVFCPEYHLLTNEVHQKGDPRLIDELLGQCPEAKRYLPGLSQSNWKQFLDHDGLWIAHQWVGRAFRAARKRNAPEKIYARASFNEYGDMVAHYGRRAESMMPLGPVPELTPECLEKTVAILNRFHQDCKGRGVSLYFSYPPLMEPIYADSKVAIEQLHDSLQDRIDIPMLNSPSKFAFSEDHFYDTGYHLTQEASEARTLYIADAIARSHFGGPDISVAKKK